MCLNVQLLNVQVQACFLTYPHRGVHDANLACQGPLARLVD